MSVVKGARQETISSASYRQLQQSVGGDQTWQKSRGGVSRCLGRLQFTGSPCSFTISPVIKGTQPRNYQSVNYWDAAKQIYLLIEAHWLPLQDAAVVQMTKTMPILFQCCRTLCSRYLKTFLTSVFLWILKNKYNVHICFK